MVVWESKKHGQIIEQCLNMPTLPFSHEKLWISTKAHIKIGSRC